MTTIAFDGKSLAADGFETWGGEIIHTDTEKIRRLRDGRIVAMAGSAAMMQALCEWVADKHCEPKERPEMVDSDGGWEVLVWDGRSTHLTRYTNKYPYPNRFDAVVGFGAGGEIATGAMLAGASAEEAVRIVSARCNHTGGTIQVVHAMALQEAAE